MDQIKRSIEDIPIRKAETETPPTKRRGVSIHVNRDLGRNIRGMRETIGLTRAQVAREIGWHPNFLAAVESGAASLSVGQRADLERWTQARTFTPMPE